MLHPPPPPPPPPPKRFPPPPPKLQPVNHGNRFILSPRIILDPEEITGKSIAILGTNGSGKSGTARRLAEEHLAKGFPFTVADIENEYATLKEVGEVLIAGAPIDYGSIKVDVALTNSGEFHEMGRQAYEEKLTVVLLLGDLDDDTRKLYLNAYLSGIFEAANNPKTAHYYRVFLEEIQEFCPQVGIAKSDPLRQTIIRFAKRGRKRKLSMVMISQRPSNVDKDVLTQAHAFLLHFVTYATDINVYRDSLGVENAEDRVKIMQPGDAIYIFGRVFVEDRITKPQTVSPWDGAATFHPENFRPVEGLEELQKTVIREGTSDEGMTVIPTVELRSLRENVAMQDMELQSLREEVSKPKPLPPPPPPPGSTNIVALQAQVVHLTQENTQLQKLVRPLHLLIRTIKENINAA